MQFGLTRDEVWELIQQNISTEVLVKHSLATEAIMRALAERLGEDPEIWGLVGLAHDLDFDKTKDTPHQHTLVTAEILREKGVSEEIIAAIIGHNEAAEGSVRQKPLDHALACAESVTGLIVATALIMPDKKLASVKPKSVRKRMKEKAFARNVNRSAIVECEKLGLELDEFLTLSVQAMQGVSDELGL